MPTVKDVIKRDRPTCSTSAIRGLSLQIIDEINLLIPGILVPIDDLDIPDIKGGVNLFMQLKAKESLRRVIKRRGQAFPINSCYRTVAQQHILFSWQGSRCVSVAATPGKSNHEDGFALDTPEFSAWKAALEAEDWDWFGPRDEVHFTYMGSGMRNDVGDIGVEAFQILWNKHNSGDKIKVDGSYGPATASRLDRSPASGFGIILSPFGNPIIRILKVTDPLMEGEDIRKVQNILAELKLLELEQVDGFYGENTALAVEVFQRKNGLSVDGQVGPSTRKALGI
jgi:hypothetical protein